MSKASDKKTMVIPMKRALYNRAFCIRLARKIISAEKISGMSVRELAIEIYAHAYVYYNFRFVPGFMQSIKPVRSVYRSGADGVDLEDHGDTWYRKIAYKVFWILPRFAA